MINEHLYPHKTNEDGTITLLCGSFNNALTSGITYLASDDLIEKFSKETIGKEIGEYIVVGEHSEVMSHTFHPHPTKSFGTVTDIEVRRVGKFDPVPQYLVFVTIEPRGPIKGMVERMEHLQLAVRGLSEVVDVDALKVKLIKLSGYDLILDNSEKK